MEKECQEKNLELLSIKTKYGVYHADENQLIVYCLTKLEKKEGRKLVDYDYLYLMTDKQYRDFSNTDTKHSACFVYKDVVYGGIMTIHPSILIIRIDEASNYQDYPLKNDEHLGQFLVWNERGYREINMYTIFMNDLL